MCSKLAPSPAAALRSIKAPADCVFGASPRSIPINMPARYLLMRLPKAVGHAATNVENAGVQVCAVSHSTKSAYRKALHGDRDCAKCRYRHGGRTDRPVRTDGRSFSGGSPARACRNRCRRDRGGRWRLFLQPASTRSILRRNSHRKGELNYLLICYLDPDQLGG